MASSETPFATSSTSTASWIAEVLLLLCLLAPIALAHPFGAESAAHHSELWLAPDHVRVRYTAEVPRPVIVANARLRPGIDPVTAMSAELRAGLILLADGEALPLAVSGPAVIRDDANATTLALSFTARLPPSTHALVWTHGNLPEIPAWSATTVFAEPGIEVLDSNLLEMRNGEIARDRAGQWRYGDDGRTVSVTLAVRDGPLHRVARWLAGDVPPRPLAHARVRPMDTVRPGRIEGTLGAIGLALATGASSRSMPKGAALTALAWLTGVGSVAPRLVVAMAIAAATGAVAGRALPEDLGRAVGVGAMIATAAGALLASAS